MFYLDFIRQGPHYNVIVNCFISLVLWVLIKNGFLDQHEIEYFRL